MPLTKYLRTRSWKVAYSTPRLGCGIDGHRSESRPWQLWEAERIAWQDVLYPQVRGTQPHSV